MQYDVLVTGGAGFIGSNLVKLYNEFGHQGRIYIADSLGTDDKWQNLVDLHFHDIIHPEELIAKLPQIRPHVIYHLGACSATTNKNADYLLKNNTQYSSRLYEAMQSYAGSLVPSPYLPGWSGPRFLYASSAATYGLGDQGFDDFHAALNPDPVWQAQYEQRRSPSDLFNLKPLNMYGYSKHLFDLFAQSRGFWDKSYCLGLKYFNVYGPKEAHKADMQSVVSKSVKTISELKKIELFASCRPDIKDGEQKRDFIYVKDAVYVTYLLAHLPYRIGGAYNIGTGEAHSFNELANAAFEALRLKPKIDYISMPDYLRPKYQHYTCADIRQTREALRQLAQSLTPQKLTPFPLFTLQTGVKDYITKHLVLSAPKEEYFTPNYSNLFFSQSTARPEMRY